MALVTIISIFSCMGCTQKGDVIAESLKEETGVVSEEIVDNNIKQIKLDDIKYGPTITVGEFDKNGWKLDVGYENSRLLKKLLNAGSGSVALKCYNDKYTARVNGNLDYENDGTFTIDVVYTLFSYTEQGIDGLITEISILPYNWHDRTFIDTYPSVEYEGIKLGDSYEVVKKILGSPKLENGSIFLECTWEYDNGIVTLSFDREKDFMTGITYKITKR